MSERAGSTPAEGVHLRYYRLHEGRWRGEYRFVITDRARFRSAALTWIDRARILSLAHTSRLMGYLTMRTSVDCDVLGEGRVLHTTRLSRFGVPMLYGRELLTLDGEGRSAAMRIEHRLPPVFSLRAWDDGRVTVDEDLAGARYDLPWIGGRIVQRTRVVSGGLALEQESPWSYASVSLHRDGLAPVR